MESSTKSGWLTKDGEAPSEWPQGEREHQRDGKRRGREREAKLMQLLSRTNAFGAAEYRSHISSDCSLPSTEPASCSMHYIQKPA